MNNEIILHAPYPVTQPLLSVLQQRLDFSYRIVTSGVMQQDKGKICYPLILPFEAIVLMFCVSKLLFSVCSEYFRRFVGKYISLLRTTEFYLLLYLSTCVYYKARHTWEYQESDFTV